jgi:hypothetical protein
VRHALAVAAVPLVLVLALAACGGDPDEQSSTLGRPTASGQTSSKVGDPFAARAQAVCQTALEAKLGWRAFPAADFDPSQPDPDAFPEVAEWLDNEVAPTFEVWLDGLTTLGTPPSGQESWSDVLSAIKTIVELNADQVAAAKRDDAEGFVVARDGLEAIQPELERATRAAGVPTCADVHK